MYWYKLGRYLILCCGVYFPLQSVIAAPPLKPSAGERLFTIHCAVCHGRKGQGGTGPSLARADLVRATTYKSLIEVITDGIPGTEMEESGLEDAEIRQLALYIRQLGRQPVEPVSGNRRIGEQLYWDKGGCSGCHILKGQGTAVGPDLTDVGSRRGASYLRTFLIDPGMNTPASFLQVRLRTKDGRNIFGVRVNEDTFSIQIRDVSGRTYSFFKSELVELDKQRGKSPMPSYRDTLSKKELDDMVAFLASLRGER